MYGRGEGLSIGAGRGSGLAAPVAGRQRYADKTETVEEGTAGFETSGPHQGMAPNGEAPPLCPNGTDWITQAGERLIFTSTEARYQGYS